MKNKFETETIDVENTPEALDEQGIIILSEDNVAEVLAEARTDPEAREELIELYKAGAEYYKGDLEFENSPIARHGRRGEEVVPSFDALDRKMARETFWDFLGLLTAVFFLLYLFPLLLV